MFLVISLLTINCITLKLPERKSRPKTPPELKQDIISFSKGNIKPGTRVLVILNSGTLVSGKFDGLAQIPPEEYAENYADSREKNKGEIMLPALGENVIMLNARGNKFECEFLGFDFGIIWVRQTGRAESEKTKLSRIKNIMDSKGKVCEVKTINKLISEGRIPFLSSGIIVKDKEGPIKIGWEDIYQIQVEKKGMPLFTTLAIGAAGAAILIYVVIDGIKKSLEEEECFSAAAYDLPAHPHVMVLRDFRDTYLMPSKLGRKLVDLYYKYSPFFAHFIARHKALKVAVRIGLLPIIAFSYAMVNFGPIITAVMTFLIFALAVFLASFLRRKLMLVRNRQP